MAIYTVHEPPRREADALAHTERFVFLRDGFSWPAFLFGPLWMIRHRLWLALVAYLVGVALLVFAMRAVGGSPLVTIIAIEIFSLLVGIEASTLRRWKLARRDWTSLGVVVGDDLEAAERRFFDAWVRDADVSRLPSVATPPANRGPVTPSHDVIGLFPEPGARP